MGRPIIRTPVDLQSGTMGPKLVLGRFAKQTILVDGILMKLQSKIFSVLFLSSSIATYAIQQEQPASAAKTNPSPMVEKIGDKIRAVNGGSSQATEIAKMTEAGVDEKAILSYVEGLPPMRVKADDVIYLHEKGVPSTIITALLQHAAAASAAQQQAATAAAAAAPAQAAQYAQPAQPAAPTPVYIQQPEPVYVSPPPVVYTVPSYSYYAGCYPYYSRPYYSRPYFSVGFSTGFPFHHGFHSFPHQGFHHSGGGFHVYHHR
jgi:hypothetical protein